MLLSKAERQRFTRYARGDGAKGRIQKRGFLDAAPLVTPLNFLTVLPKRAHSCYHLGMDVFRPKTPEVTTARVKPFRETIAQVEQGYPFSAFLDLSERLGVAQSLLASVLNISSSTLQRRRGGVFDVAESGRIYQLEKLIDLAETTIGDEEDARRWLTTRNPNLGETPLELTRTAPGIEAVTHYLEQVQAGVYL